MGQILDLFTRSVTAVSLWFGQIMSASSGENLFLSIFFVVLSIRFLVYPLLSKSAGSDKAQKGKNEED